MLKSNILNELIQLYKNKILIVITHDHSVIKQADSVVYLTEQRTSVNNNNDLVQEVCEYNQFDTSSKNTGLDLY